MKNKFVADGAQRLWLGRKALISESLEKRYDAELANAGSDEKDKIRERMAKESLQREKALKHKPSSATLW